MKKVVLLLLLVASNLLPMLKKEVFFINGQIEKISREKESNGPGIWNELIIHNDTKFPAAISTSNESSINGKFLLLIPYSAYCKIKTTAHLTTASTKSIIIENYSENNPHKIIGIKFNDKKIKLLCPKKRPDQLGVNDFHEFNLKISDIISAIKQ